MCMMWVCLFGSVCVRAYVWLWVFSDLSRNKFTKIGVEVAPLLATLYRPNLLASELGHTTDALCDLRLVRAYRSTFTDSRGAFLPFFMFPLRSPPLLRCSLRDQLPAFQSPTN